MNLRRDEEMKMKAQQSKRWAMMQDKMEAELQEATQPARYTGDAGSCCNTAAYPTEPGLRGRANETLRFLQEAHERVSMIEGAVSGPMKADNGCCSIPDADSLESTLAHICESSAVLVGRLSTILQKL